MEIRELKKDGVVVLGLTGRLDAESVPALQSRLQALIDAGEHRLVVEAAGLTYVSSSGLRLLLEISKRLDRHAGRLVLCAAPESVRRVLEIAGLTSLLRLFDTSKEAIGHCQAEG
jgi:anti-anti-sigma factor